MPKKISITLLFTLVIAIVALFAATQVGAFSQPDGECPSTEGDIGECWERNGVVMEIVPDVLTGEFPVKIGGNSVFKYQITQKNKWPWTGWLRYRQMWVDLLIQVQDPKLNIIDSDPVSLPPFWGLKEDGHGDKSAVFGIRLTGDDTWKWKGLKLKDIPQVSFWSLTFEGSVAAVPNGALVRRSPWPQYWGFGRILRPGGLPLENEPVSARTLFTGEEFDWEILNDAGGNSNDAKCVPPSDCVVTTLKIDEIQFGDGWLDSLPFDEGFVVGDSPGCTYVRTRSGGVKRLCK